MRKRTRRMGMPHDAHQVNSKGMYGDLGKILLEKMPIAGSRTVLTDKQRKIIVNAGFTIDEDVSFPCYAGHTYVRNWEELILWMVDQKMTG